MQICYEMIISIIHIGYRTWRWTFTFVVSAQYTAVRIAISALRGLIRLVPRTAYWILSRFGISAKRCRTSNPTINVVVHNQGLPGADISIVSTGEAIPSQAFESCIGQASEGKWEPTDAVPAELVKLRLVTDSVGNVHVSVYVPTKRPNKDSTTECDTRRSNSIRSRPSTSSLRSSSSCQLPPTDDITEIVPQKSESVVMIVTPHLLRAPAAEGPETAATFKASSFGRTTSACPTAQAGVLITTAGSVDFDEADETSKSCDCWCWPSNVLKMLRQQHSPSRVLPLSLHKGDPVVDERQEALSQPKPSSSGEDEELEPLLLPLTSPTPEPPKAQQPSHAQQGGEEHQVSLPTLKMQTSAGTPSLQDDEKSQMLPLTSHPVSCKPASITFDGPSDVPCYQANDETQLEAHQDKLPSGLTRTPQPAGEPTNSTQIPLKLVDPQMSELEESWGLLEQQPVLSSPPSAQPAAGGDELKEEQKSSASSAAEVEQQPVLSSPRPPGGGDELQGGMVEQEQQQEEPAVVEELKPASIDVVELLEEEQQTSFTVQQRISLALDQQLLSLSLVELQAIGSLVVKQQQPHPTESAPSPPNNEVHQLQQEQSRSVTMTEEKPKPSSLSSTASTCVKEKQKSLVVEDQQPRPTIGVKLLQEHDDDVFKAVEKFMTQSSALPAAGQQEVRASTVEQLLLSLPAVAAGQQTSPFLQPAGDDFEAVQVPPPPTSSSSSISLSERHHQSTPLLSPPAETAEVQAPSSPITAGQKHVTLLRRRQRWLLLCRRVLPAAPAVTQRPPRGVADEQSSSAKLSLPDVDEQSTPHHPSQATDNLASFPPTLSFEIEMWDPSSEAPSPPAQSSSVLLGMNLDLQEPSHSQPPQGKESLPIPSTLSLEVKILEPTSEVADQEQTESPPFNNGDDGEADAQKCHTLPSSTLALEVQMLEPFLSSLPSSAAERASLMPAAWSLELKLSEPALSALGEHEPTPWPPSPEPYQVWAPSSPTVEQNPMSMSLSVEVKLCRPASSSSVAPPVEQLEAPLLLLRPRSSSSAPKQEQESSLLLEALPAGEQQSAAAGVPTTLSLEIKLQQEPSKSCSEEQQQQHPMPSTLSMQVKLWEPSTPQQATLVEHCCSAVQSTPQQEGGELLQESQQPSEERVRSPMARLSPALRSVIAQMCVSMLCMTIIPRVLPVGGRLLAYVSNLAPFRGGRQIAQLAAGISTEVAAAAGLQTHQGVVAVEVGAIDATAAGNKGTAFISSSPAGANRGVASQFDLDNAFSECNSKWCVIVRPPGGTVQPPQPAAAAPSSL
ncbi:hypothetical protein VaNZ11_002349 [Volvox africanus]|uniref:C2 NT-type domain-containing protein n=1 Tax=Volvox africanus TaxID=51714 RepID=A0ABQ5RSM6_9CHLO|nr:hypothetical protein VaNZ11_002349 [Volvox africanus]